MAKHTNDKKIKVNVNSEQKAMLAAVQAEPVEKTDETVAANENEPQPKKKGLANTPSPDGRTQKERRAARLALRDKALNEALEQNLPFDEKIKAIKFEEDYEAAFKEATESPEAIPADTIRAIKKAVEESLQENKAAKTPTQELVDAAKATVTPTPEPEDKSPEAVVVGDTVHLVSRDGELVGETKHEGITKVTYDGEEYRIDKDGQLVQNMGESSKKFGQRKHKFKRAVYLAKQAEKQAQEAELEGRNGSPPTPSEINKTIPMDVTDEEAGTAEPVKLAEESAETLKVCDDLVKESEEADAKKKAANDEPADETPVAEQNEQESAETDVPTVVAPETAPTEQLDETKDTPVVEETKTVEPSSTNVEDKAPVQPPKVVVDNTKKGTERTPEQIAAAKKFYGSAWNNERAGSLANAHYWLTRAVDADLAIRGITPLKVPTDPRTLYRMAMNSALKHECEALGGNPHTVTIAEVNELYGMPEAKAKAA